jgi:fructosamine-3-kinase
MKYSEIEAIPISKHEPQDAKSIRKHGPYYVKSVIDDTHALPGVQSIEELRTEHLKAMGGGVDAATYLLRAPKQSAIIKLSYGGLEAEAEVLRAWRERNVRVPKVLAQGVVPVTANQKSKVKFLVQQAMLDTRGRMVETCAEFLTLHPDKARQVGEALGRQLNRMHSVVADRSFGEFADSPGNTAAYASWNSYIIGHLDANAEYLQHLGVHVDDIKRIREAIGRHAFVPRGRYLHGDFSIRNTAVKSYDPLKVFVFDPNPAVGDPSWDLAALFNNYEFQKRRLEHADDQRDVYVRDQQLVAGFKNTYTRHTSEGSLRIARFMQGVYQAQYEENKEGEAIDFKVRKEFALETAEAIIRREDA